MKDLRHWILREEVAAVVLLDRVGMQTLGCCPRAGNSNTQFDPQGLIL